MQRIGLDKNWDFYESDESMSFVFATPPSQKVDLPHDFIVGKPRSADAPGGPGDHVGKYEEVRYLHHASETLRRELQGNRLALV